jgi:hypothetical protein
MLGAWNLRIDANDTTAFTIWIYILRYLQTDAGRVVQYELGCLQAADTPPYNQVFVNFGKCPRNQLRR